MSKKLLKVISIICIFALMCTCLCGCMYTNKRIIDTQWKFNYAYISLPGGDIIEVNVESWTEDSTTLTIKAENGNVYCIAPVNCLMTKDKLEKY